MALVLGNGDYAVGPLANPTNDARLISTTLESRGFEVRIVEDADLRSMQRAIVEFGRALRASGDDTVGMVYYAGHAVQSSGENYLIPVDADIQDELDLPIQTVEVEYIMRTLDAAGNSLNIVVLDACRNNPFRSMSRSGTRGLAKVDAPQGTLLAYSTAPGAVALDGNTDNSPYTKALASVLRQPGLPVEQVFKQVRIRVMETTGQQQVPWESSSLTGDFYFTEAAAEPAPVAAPAQAPQVDQNVAEIEFWRSIASENDPALFQSYLNAYPNGLFSGVAEQRIASLQAAASNAEAEARVAQAKSLWDSISASTDPALFQTLIGRYPDTVYAELAQSRIASLEAQRQAQAAADALAVAQANAQQAQAAQPSQVPAQAPAQVAALPPATARPASGLTDGRYSLEVRSTGNGVHPWCRANEYVTEEIEVEDGRFSDWFVSIFGANGQVRLKTEKDGTVSGQLSGKHWENDTRWVVELAYENGVWKGLSEKGGVQDICRVDFALSPISAQ